MDVAWELEQAKSLIDRALLRIENAPEVSALITLIEKCESLDAHYKRACEEVDLDNGDEIGTAYEGGFSMEYYIESDWWQEISEALRVLRKDK